MDDSDKHLRHIKKNRRYTNAGENSNMRFSGYDDFYFPKVGQQSYQQYGGENGRAIRVINNTDRPANYNPYSRILNNISRYIDSA
jgi:hypothetical protein